MQRTPLKFALAGMLAVVGIVMMWRVFIGSLPTPPPAPVYVVPEQVRSALDNLVLDTTPTPETAVAISDRVEARTLEEVRAAIKAGRMRLSTAQINDLGDAINERMLVLLAPDWERGLANLRARGCDPPASDEIRQGWEKGVQWRDGLPRLGLGQLQVRTAYDRGKPVHHDTLGEGWSTLTGKLAPSVLPVSTDAEKDRLTVVEVILPLEHRGVRHESIYAWPTGFLLAWSEDRKQWIPWKSIIYKAGQANDDEVFSMAPFL